MKKISFAVLCLLCCIVSGCKSMPIDRQRVMAREMVFLNAHFTDYRQTIGIVNNPKKYIEMDNILGKHPSKARVQSFFVITGLLHAGVSYLLPEDYAEVWQVSNMIGKLETVTHNASCGLKTSNDINFYVSYKIKF